MTYQPEYDVVMPDFGRDLVYGEAAEEVVEYLSQARVEVKRKRRIDPLFYVETHQAPRGGEVKPSGINVTRADYFAYVLGDTGVIVFMPTSLLKAACRDGNRKQESDGNNPTWGRLIGFGDLDSAKKRRAA